MNNAPVRDANWEACLLRLCESRTHSWPHAGFVAQRTQSWTTLRTRSILRPYQNDECY